MLPYALDESLTPSPSSPTCQMGSTETETLCRFESEHAPGTPPTGLPGHGLWRRQVSLLLGIFKLMFSFLYYSVLVFIQRQSILSRHCEARLHCKTRDMPRPVLPTASRVSTYCRDCVNEKIHFISPNPVLARGLAGVHAGAGWGRAVIHVRLAFPLSVQKKPPDSGGTSTWALMSRWAKTEHSQASPREGAGRWHTAGQTGLWFGGECGKGRRAEQG